jgi:P-type conjugative transfer protein TrbG/P-type conjugative transfer protein TrbL
MRKRIHISVRWLPAIALGGLFVQAIFAQSAPFTSTVPSQIMEQFRNQRTQWTTNVWVYANTLFGILAVIEFAWSAAVMLLEKTDFQSWTSALIRKLMWIGAFYALLLNGRYWIPAIIDSFTQIGQNAAGLGALSPSGVFVQGLKLAGALIDGGSSSAFFTNPGSSLVLGFAALLIVVSYTIITINFIVTLVESYLVVSVGFIFLGFGGSRWTAPYTERYLGLAVSIGIKIVLLYCLISAGFNLSVGWLDEAQGIATSARPAMTAFDVMGGSLIFMMCCWQIPKLFAAVIGGSPALTGGDLIATAAAVGSAALAVGDVPSPGPDGRVMFSFGAGLPTVVCAPLRVCMIELEAGEKIVGEPHIGDSVRWNISPAMYGTRDRATAVVILKPQMPGLDTNLLITTDRRAYYLRLISNPEDYVARVAFAYPENDARKWQQQLTAEQTLAKQEKHSTEIPPAMIAIEKVNFDYAIRGGDDHIRPVRVFDDGAKTYIQMPPDLQHREAPVLLVVGKDGKGEMTNYRVKDQTYIVDRLFDRANLVLGSGKKAQKVEISRGHNQ